MPPMSQLFARDASAVPGGTAIYGICTARQNRVCELVQAVRHSFHELPQIPFVGIGGICVSQRFGYRLLRFTRPKK